MSHGHVHHSINERRTAFAAVLTAVFTLAELAGGIISGSLALIADALHMATDALSLGLAWFAFRLSRRPADSLRTFGFARLQILVAFANGVALFFIVGWIIVEAIGRLSDPVPVMGETMATIAVLGLLVNIAAFAILHGADRESLNIRGAMLHVLGDLLGSVAALAAAAVILGTGWTPIDPILSIVVALIVLRSAIRLIKDAGHILLEGAPAHIDPDQIERDLVSNLEAVEDVHHVHAWSLTEQRPMITLHARIQVPKEGSGPTVAAIKQRLAAEFGISHATVEIEEEICADAQSLQPGRTTARSDKD